MSVCVSVYLSLATFLHYWTNPDVTLGNGRIRGAPSCALLGAFAIGAQVSLLWQHMHLMCNVSKCSCTRCMADWQCHHFTDAYDFLFICNRNNAFILYHFQDIATVKICQLRPTQPLFGAPLRVTPFEFHQDLRHQKT